MGRKSTGFGACPCAGRIVRNGGTPAAHRSLVNPTGSTAGTGVRVSGLTVCLWALSLGEAARGSEGKGQWKVRSPFSTPTEKKHCPAHAPCLSFLYHFPTPDDLCEKIWNNTFKASPERRKSGRCLQKWFEPTQSNPNVEVALHFASSALAPQFSYTLPAFSLCLLFHP